jgi:hypothetical protein
MDTQRSFVRNLVLIFFALLLHHSCLEHHYHLLLRSCHHLVDPIVIVGKLSQQEHLHTLYHFLASLHHHHL